MDDAMLLVGDSESDQNLYYKTHFLAGDTFAYLEADGRKVLLVSDMEKGRAEKESIVPEVRTFDDLGYTDLIKENKNRTEAFTTVLTRLIDGTSRRVRVEGRLPVMYADRLRTQGIELEVDADLLNRERRQKSEAEIDAIEAAQRATERATAHALEILRASEELGGVLNYNGIPLTSERLRTEIDLFLMREGMDPGDAIVAGGPGAADPHWRGSGPLRAGEAIVLDVFPRSKQTRYFADMTRTVVKGEPREGLQEMYDAVLAAHAAALSRIRAGASGKDIHDAVLDLYRQHGYGPDGGPWMRHGTGHGVGLDIHEAPNVGIAGTELIEGDVVTIEPGLYDPEVGAIRIEDLVVVTADGYRNLTNFPKEFRL